MEKITLSELKQTAESLKEYIDGVIFVLESEYCTTGEINNREIDLENEYKGFKQDLHNYIQQCLYEEMEDLYNQLMK